MNYLEAILIAIVEGLTEFLPISSTAHMIFLSTFFGIEENEYVKMYEVSIQFGAILAVVVMYAKKFLNFKSFNFYIKLALAVIPALVLGYLFDDKIEAVMGNTLAIAIMLVIGGVVLLFVDNWFTKPTVTKEEDISIKNAVTIGFWQCLAMMPGTSRAAASIIGGMQQKLTRKLAAEFSFFLAVPTMLAVTVYSLFLKDWTDPVSQETISGIDMILASGQNTAMFVIGNLVAFIVALITIRLFIGFLQKNDFKAFGWYRIIFGSVMIIYLLLFK